MHRINLQMQKPQPMVTEWTWPDFHLGDQHCGPQQMHNLDQMHMQAYSQVKIRIKLDRHQISKRRLTPILERPAVFFFLVTAIFVHSCGAHDWLSPQGHVTLLHRSGLGLHSSLMGPTFNHLDTSSTSIWRIPHCTIFRYFSQISSDLIRSAQRHLTASLDICDLPVEPTLGD